MWNGELNKPYTCTYSPTRVRSEGTGEELGDCDDDEMRFVTLPLDVVLKIKYNYYD